MTETGWKCPTCGTVYEPSVTLCMPCAPKMSIVEACKALGVNRRTIYNWINSGRVQYIRTAGGKVRILSASLWRDATGAEIAANPVVSTVKIGLSK